MGWHSDVPSGMDAANRARPVQTSPPAHGPLISPTGSPGLNSVIDVVNNTAAPFMNAPPPEQGAAGWVAQGLGGVLGVIGAPMMIIDTAFASLTAPIAALFPGMPALTLGAMHVAPPHTHTHPPSLIPPAPPVPLPSLGVTLGSGSVTVLVGGMPAARAGDIGLAVTCGSLAPPFEIFTGSSNVFIGGARAARMLDLTKHCNPTSMGPFAIAMGAAGVVAGAAGAIATGNAYAAAQAAADAAVLAIKLLCGKDPGLPPGMGALVGPPVGNVLIGGFPCPPIGEMAMGGIMKLIGKAVKALKNARNARRGNAHCGDASEPIYLPTGENFNTFVDFVSGGLFEWRRHYTTKRCRDDGPLGFGWRHFFQRSLSVRLHRATFTDWDGERIEFPRFPRGSDTTRADGYVLHRIARGRYRISTIDGPTMEFAGGEFEGELPLVKLVGDGRELELQYDSRGLLCACVESRAAVPRQRQRWELRRNADGYLVEIVEVGVAGPGGSAAGAAVSRAAFGYSKSGELVQVRDALDGRWAYAYDGFHRLAKQTDPRGYSYSWQYDVWGRCTQASGQDGLWWARFEYFPDDKFTRYVEGDEAAYEFHYADDGFITKIVDPYGGETIRERDEDGRLVREIDSGGRQMLYLYDGNDAHHGRVDEYGNIYPPEFDMPSLPKVVRHEVPETALERQYAGLAAPQPLAVHGASPSVLDAVPEAQREWARRSLRVRGTGAAIALPPPRRERDALGRVVREVDAAGRTRQWRYDGTGNVVAEIDRDGRVTERRITSWNLVGEVVDPLGRSRRFRYSKLEHVIAFTDPLGNTTRYDWDKKERLVRVHRHGRVRDEYVYDVGDHLVAKLDGNGTAVFECTPHEKHLAGTRTLAVGGKHELDYDRRGRVTAASTDAHEVQLGRDTFGHRVHDLCDEAGVCHRHAWIDDARTPRRTTTVLDRFTIVEETLADGSI
ncbi:MAG TPA: DUF6531 domain-containing protein, partial [Nannocystaceae bacterium]|nr:DUF6531 domain-containing protein [Nannocystaceae bacterium]